ncbi:D-aminoacyl-tRNA deacylase [Propionimicrobium lymphophilum]|uniref:D-aminoacyl-tRNA deacylase n=1 Tax=Propionimicrobium lymphophilum ACS-093-V-SCH5 TaxID=883161 RepID=S2W1T0_9ACTN|nr:MULTISPECIES: D-aminoacyl-tRNA deacylase [Propionimicrobium]EPD32290.1 D-tyrosyl-tRNA(Tyr) deacylase [Propionimicrobium lymphophilum ACS-093-V-SCH5]ETJ97175.1 D-tyrosyl-tRNA(Tyr) deacylase [Propionimicrobium sp. BV2F7]MDK7709483.1 D-aminoacyl-tRNA deacylase [Propionimicrobium lymphophilum]MDK7733469.1 D-aminoacyl-tRNA deacylase [Propionimicrobium lymphophilum]
MRVVLQRAKSANVSIDGEIVGKIDSPGLVLLVGITHDDTPELTRRMAEKIWKLRILEGEVSASDVDAPVLAVSQFTLYANTRKGRRPSWNQAAPGEISEPLFNQFVEDLRGLGAHVETGKFGAEMQVSLVNDGPVTIILDSADWGSAK